MISLPLIIEKADTGFVGRTTYQKNLIVHEAENLDDLEKTIQKLLKKIHGLSAGDYTFKHQYDLSALFEKFSYLKISNVAEAAGINASLLRQYVIGKKFASANQAKKIEETIHEIGRELLKVKIYSQP